MAIPVRVALAFCAKWSKMQGCGTPYDMKRTVTVETALYSSVILHIRSDAEKKEQWTATRT